VLYIGQGATPLLMSDRFGQAGRRAQFAAVTGGLLWVVWVAVWLMLCRGSNVMDMAFAGIIRGEVLRGKEWK